MIPFVPLRDRLALFARHRVDPSYAHWALLALGWSSLSVPLRLYERLRHGRRIARTAIDPEPLFVLGCARSGTTHLQNLLCRDPRFAHVSNYQSLTQGFVLSSSRWLLPLMERRGARRRPMDAVRLDPASPQEEDVVMASATRHSVLHALSFPRDGPEFFRRYVLMELEAREQAAWDRAYLDVLRVASLQGEGRPLVLKSPAHTARIPTLLRLFPRARFVHIHRDPYDVLRSVLHAYAQVLPQTQLQRVDPARVEDDFVASYQVMMARYLRDRAAIPDGRHVEVAYADLAARPLDTLAGLYAELGLEDFAATRPHVEAYLATLGDYAPNDPRVPAAVLRRVNADWGFALDTWGYPRREDGDAAPGPPVGAPGR